MNLLESLPHTESRPMLKAKCALCKLEDTITVNYTIKIKMKK